MISGLILNSTSQAMDSKNFLPKPRTLKKKLQDLKNSWGTNKENEKTLRYMLEHKEIAPYLYDSLLIYAVKVYAGKAVKILLDAGANPNAIEEYTECGASLGTAKKITNHVLSLAVDPYLREYGFNTYSPTKFSGPVIEPSYAPAIKEY